jgi:hypothetical protein
MSLLSIVVEVCGRLSLSQPTAVATSTDAQVIQLMTLANVAGRDLAQAYDWQAITEEKTFVTVAATTQPNAFPADFDHFIANSGFNRTTRRPINGPVTAAQWQALQAQPQLNTVFLVYNERQGAFNLSPVPPAGQTIAYAYISTNWAKSAGISPTPQAAFLVDTDTSYLDESLIADSLVWRFLRAKGLSYAEEMATYERNLEQQQARDGGSTILSLSPQAINLSRANLPDGNFGA